jgi:hypothetical protein
MRLKARLALGLRVSVPAAAQALPAGWKEVVDPEFPALVEAVDSRKVLDLAFG